MTFFNADQTNNAAKVAAQAYKAPFKALGPRSAMTGVPYKGSMNNVLYTAAKTNQHSSVYWLTQKQATFLGFEITAGQKPTEITLDDKGIIRLFNASQTNSKDVIEARLKN